MGAGIVLASGSDIRKQLLLNAGLEFDISPARIDEESIKQALIAESAKPRDIADALAEFKARKISEKNAHGLVIGCDQVLSFDGDLLSKPETPEHARDQLRRLRDTTHHLHTAVVIYEDSQPVWRKVATVRLRMRDFSDDYLNDYIARNWQSIRHSVGGYKLEEEGVRLFSSVEGDYFAVLGLPLLDVLNYLTLRGALQT
ncbi:MAG: nucleoside triphosphate pyrophosphatase [Roseovarius sp.]|jgi:septum formation protein|nr:nucleoside triphosphate pyrophosphatase [Roseovarius sp.]